MPFDPDKYLAQKERLKSEIGFDPDKYLAEKQLQDAPGDAAGAALEGFGQGASLGYLAELQAMAGKLMPDPNAEMDAKLKAKGFKIQQGDESYLQLRDENVKRQHNLSKSNPVAYYGSMVGGGIATAPAVTGALTRVAPVLAGAGTTAKIAATGAAIGAAANPGSTEGEIAPIQPVERLKNAAIGAGLGVGLTKLGQAVSKPRRGLPPRATPPRATEPADSAFPLLRKKINAANIEAAAKELGIELTPGQLLDDGYLQKLDDLLRESPSMVGRGQANVVDKGIKAASKAAEDALEGANFRSGGEVGGELKTAVVGKLRAEKAPISAMYDKVRESTQNIELNPKSLEAISRNVSKLREARLGPTKGMVSGIADDIKNLKTVDDVKFLRSQIRTAPTATPAEKMAVANIDARLRALEEGSVVRTAKSLAKDTKDKALGDELLKLVGERKGADKAWAQFRGKLDDLSEIVGGKVRSPEEYLQKIEAIPDEKMASLLFSKKNYKGFKFVQEQFPEQAAQIVEFEKGQLLSRFTRDGKVNGSALVKEVMNDKKYSPEIRRMMFGQDGLKKLQAAKTYFESLPAKANPSGTATAGDVLSFWGNPIKATGMTARDLLIKGVLKSAEAGDSAAVKSAYSAATNTVKEVGRKSLSTLDQVQKRALVPAVRGSATERKPYLGPDRRNVGEDDKPKKGPEKWANDGIEKLKEHGADAEQLKKLKETAAGRKILVAASDLKPGSKAMAKLAARIS